MLGKMIKHEFKATGRLYLPLFLITLVLTPVLGLLFKFSGGIGEGSFFGTIVSGMSMTGYVIMLIALCIASFIYVIVRFYKTVATSEAYLTFCLPVKPTDILTSKLVVGVIWELLSVGVMLLSIFVMLTIQGSDIPQKAFDVLGKIAPILATEYGSVAFFFIHMGLIILIASIAGTLAFFLSICLGQLFNEHRVIMSIAMYVGVYTVSQILSVVVFMPFLLSDPKAMIVGKVSSGDVDFAGIPTLGFFLSVGALQLALGAVYFIVCRVILKKKMNVR